MDESGNIKQEEEGGSDAPWMATYADMMTLLFCFFVLMFAISSVDAQKFALVAAAFSDTGLTPEIYAEINAQHDVVPSDNPDFTDPRIPVEPNVPDINDTEIPGIIDDGSGTGGGEGDGTGTDHLGNLYHSIESYIELNGMGDSVKVEYAGNEVMVTLKNDIWFQSGSAEVTEEMRESAVMLAGLLRDNQDENNPFNIIVVGHTDNRPISTLRYPSNWDLSVQRSVEFLRILIPQSGLNPEYFSARGCGETKPIAENTTEEGRQKNRRVELYVSYFSP